ncbi:MAG: diaminopimelate decarboxylase, partial [Chlorobiaceae bacterium]|nr:diaminopimelate decarboxylase [Chlorobiaceae bacterium]
MFDTIQFQYSGETLACEKVKLDELAATYGTPLYVTSTQSIVDSYRSFELAFADLPHFTCYSVKANFNLNVISTLAGLGSG